MKKQDLKNLKKLKLNKVPVSTLTMKKIVGGGESDFNSVCTMCTGAK
jgi:hypothetical protein